MARIEGAPEDAEDALSCGRGIFGEGGASSGFTDIVSPSKLCKMAPPRKGGHFTTLYRSLRPDPQKN